MNKKKKTILIPKVKPDTLVASADYEYPEKGYWSGIIGNENLLTGDGRFIETEALRWETPIPLRYVKSDVGAHDGAEVVGRILTIERKDNGDIWAEGDFDLGSETGREAYRQVAEKYTNGISMDLDDTSFQVRVVKELVDEVAAPLGGEMEGEELEVDADGRVVVWEGSPNDEIYAIVDALIRAATLVAIPAFKDAKIFITETAPAALQTESEDVEKFNSDNSIEALIASALTDNPPAWWFNDPELTAPTALTVDDDGRISGHLATWGVCHIGEPLGKGVCVEAPRSNTNYAYFHTGSLKTADGQLLSVGQITLNTGHAAPKASPMSAAAHYDNTGMAVADVRVGEDEFGIWIAGGLRAGVTSEQIRTLRASPLSGDWRLVAGNLELVAALAVNVPGFPVPRTEGLVASGEVTSLVAAGIVVDEKTTSQPAEGLSATDLAYLKSLISRERSQHLANLAGRVKSIRNANRVKAFVKGRK